MTEQITRPEQSPQVAEPACCDSTTLQTCCGTDAKAGCCEPAKAPKVCGCGQQSTSSTVHA